MIAQVIRWSVTNRFLVILASLFMMLMGSFSVLKTPLDAIPDLSDTQVIVRSVWPGQAPQIIENQLTYPLTSSLMAVPGAKVVRGFSFFGDSYVYVLFDESTDLYWARSRVLESLSQIQSQLPKEAKVSLGPDATGVGWVYQYALVDKTGQKDLSQLRSLQDWYLKYGLQSVKGVSEVATIGGMVRQYQVVVEPFKLSHYKIPLKQVISAIQQANQEAGGGVIELGEAELMVRASGYLSSLEDFKAIPLTQNAQGAPVTLGEVAKIQLGPEMRRGISELNGQGEAVGGVVVMRSGENALATIQAVKEKLATLKQGLPEGVEIVPTYDRSHLIESSVHNLTEKLIEEFVIVAIVCLVFLFHLRSSLVAIVSLPLGILMAFTVMNWQGINANIMSLGGIAIAIGTMIDAALVMIENAHKHFERYAIEQPNTPLSTQQRWDLIVQATQEVGPALFFSLLIITFSFLPVFTLEAQEGKLFSPLAYTKTYAMAAAAALSVSLIPVLMGYFIRGKLPKESANPLNRGIIALYRPALRTVLRFPKTTLLVATLIFLSSVWPWIHLGSEFMPPLDEGDLVYMPSALPGLSPAKAQELLQQTDRLIKTIPEVASVHGKAGRAETATDPAPLVMFETIIQFKPKDQWRPGMTQEKLIDELNRTVKVPGLTNIWIPPIRNRIDMQATGIKSPIGVKVLGEDLHVINRLTQQIEKLVKPVSGVSSAFAERVSGGRYLNVEIDRSKAAQFGLNIKDVQLIVSSAVGGASIGQVLDGLARYPINVRYPKDLRDSLNSIRNLPIVTPQGKQLILSDVAQISLTLGPPLLRSENARLAGFVYVDVHGRDIGSVVKDLQAVVMQELKLPAGYSVEWSGQYEFMQRAEAKLKLVVPLTLLIIFVLLYLAFKRLFEVWVIMLSLPFALTGGLWLLYLFGYQLSVASGVGFIALAGVSAEFGVVMLLYLNNAWTEQKEKNQSLSGLLQAVETGAVTRVRPKAMTVLVILAGLFPIMISEGAGTDVMQPIAAPMIGGMLSAPLLSLFVIPVIFYLYHQRRLGTPC